MVETRYQDIEDRIVIQLIMDGADSDMLFVCLIHCAPLCLTFALKD